MDDLKTLLDNSQIAQIEDQIKTFVHSADGYENHLKLVFSLLAVIRESASLLQTVDSSSFISDISNRITEMDGQAKSLASSYHDQLLQDKTLSDLLNDGSSNRIGNIQRDIDSLLNEYDRIIKSLVEAREKLPLESKLGEKH